ncbi:hypothetical protein TKK_0008630 [Trichogramma kaykai]|uniref:non-specific serine/threonine protein kinase n=1 Tax=Trichogramma kaykai TaxID=54128 RepID=A0ABD2X479_9HYME
MAKSNGCYKVKKLTEQQCKSEQLDEFDALSAIYCGQMRDLRGKNNKNKKKWKPMQYAINLWPQRNTSLEGKLEIHAQVDLKVECGPNYPNDVPKLSFQNAKGVSDKNLDKLLSKLYELAEQKKGSVMIFDLCQVVQSFLSPFNKPAHKSFHDAMLHRNEKLIQEKEQQIEEENRKMLKNVLSECRSVIKESHYLRSDSNQFTNFQGVQYKYKEPTKCKHNDDPEIINFNDANVRVKRIQCIKHNEDGSIIFKAADVDSLEPLCLSKWSLAYSSNQLPKIQKIISNIEKDFKIVQKMNHPNLAKYLGIESFIDDEIIRIYILKEICPVMLFSYENVFGSIYNENIIQSFTKAALRALEHLHAKNLTHDSLKQSSLLLSDNRIQINDYTIEKKLTDLCKLKFDEDVEKVETKKLKDVSRLGRLILTFLKVPLTDPITLPANISRSLDDFLRKALATEKERWSATQLLKHEFIEDYVIEESLKQIVALSHSIAIDHNRSLPIIDTGIFNKTSRLKEEFCNFTFLGKGGFGSVLKAQNKLDGRYYAIKIIRLPKKEGPMNKKIIREVKLLSRLNHDNVVRYYTSWIEESIVDPKDKTSLGLPWILMQNDEDEFYDEDVVDGAVEEYDDEDDDDDDEDDDDEDGGINSRDEAGESLCETEYSRASNTGTISEGNSIVFENGSNRSPGRVPLSGRRLSSEQPEATESSLGPDNKTSKRIIVMYIQMEFCEKSTLATAIEHNLYRNEPRLWRLFREIIEGLAHIHEQSMIHRDLKPANIFLDSSDHVKIGDFGLATNSMLSQHTHGTNAAQNGDTVEKQGQLNIEMSANGYAGSLTGEIGTASYSAPELNSKNSRAIYNQKVDIYSLGIIFFEMCRAPTTGMERALSIQKLRSKEVILPKDWSTAEMKTKANLLRWLLNHDPKQRPTSQQLLESKYIMDKFNSADETTIKNIFEQNYELKYDLVYTMNMTKDEIHTVEMPVKYNKEREAVKLAVVKIFEKYGGVPDHTNLLFPEPNGIKENRILYKMMTYHGRIVSLPCDLRIAFARFVAYNGITNLNRYSIDRVYNHERKHVSKHPEETLEAAFDKISAAPNPSADVELICIVLEIFDQIPAMRDCDVIVRVNHTSLLDAVLTHCGVEEQMLEDAKNALDVIPSDKYWLRVIKARLVSLCLPDQVIEKLMRFTKTSNISDMRKLVNGWGGTKHKLAQEGFKEIDRLIKGIQSYMNGFTTQTPFPPPKVILGPLYAYNINKYNGLMFCFLSKMKGRHETVAYGGRYDKLLKNFRDRVNYVPQVNQCKQYATGISINLDVITSFCVKYHEDQEEPFGILADVLVSVIGGEVDQQLPELYYVLSKLRFGGYKVYHTNFDKIDEANKFYKEMGIKQAIILTPPSKKVFIWSPLRKHIHNIDEVEVQDFDQFLNPLNQKDDSSSMNRSNSFSSPKPCNIEIKWNPEHDEVDQDLETQILETLSAHLQNLQKTKPHLSVECYCIRVDSNAFRFLSRLGSLKKEKFQNLVQSIMELNSHRKKYIKTITDAIWEAKTNKPTVQLILYNLNYHKWGILA